MHLNKLGYRNARRYQPPVDDDTLDTADEAGVESSDNAIGLETLGHTVDETLGKMVRRVH